MHKRIRHYFSRIIDVFVIPIIPKTHRLALQYQKYIRLIGWEPEVRRIKDYAHKSSQAIDVGANIGLWTYAIARTGMFEKILAIEPNPSLTTNLLNAGLNNVTVIHKAVSNESGKRVLKIPKLGKLTLSGWASLEEQIDLDTDQFQEILVETIRLDDLELNGIGFIKVDVEGHELNLLNGGRNLFTRNRPVCMIECRDRNKSQVEEFFASLDVGYRLIDTKTQYGFELSPGNLLFGVALRPQLSAFTLGKE